MKIAVLFIATNLKIRMKVGNKSLLKQDEKKTVGSLFNELELWMRNSDFELVPVIITCFDEIYEMAVMKHFTAFNNVFGFISEGNTIRYGITSYPDADAYFVISTGEARIFKAEIFENICGTLKNNPDKIIISRYNQKITLPMVFGRKFADPIRSANESDDGRFTLYSNNEDNIFYDITDDNLIEAEDNFHKSSVSGGFSHACNEGKDGHALSIPAKHVIIIRGGGRLGTVIAITLHQFGYRVLLTEIQNPTTLYAGMSFSKAIHTSEVEIEGTKAFLVTPGKIQIQKAWNSNAIPIIIDPDCDILQLFDQSGGKDSLLQDRMYDNAGMDTYKDKMKSFLTDNRLIALIDATSSTVVNPTTINMTPLTIGLRDDQCPMVDVHYKIKTDSFSSQYGKIISRREFDISHVSQQTAAIAPKVSVTEKTDDTAPGEKGSLSIIFSHDSGVYTGNRNIGDEIDESSIIGHIENINGEKTAIFALAEGRLIANTSSDSYVKKQEVVAVIDCSGITKDDCFRTLPADNAVSYSILSILKNQNKK